jgi:hypothetical protein
MLFEFGAGTTLEDGFSIGIHPNDQITSKDEWFARPLQTDTNMQKYFSGQVVKAAGPQSGSIYWATYLIPTISHTRSFYVYLKFKAPIVPDIAFIPGDPHGDVFLAKELWKQVGPCPRG